jgi:hypothetical protein
MVEVYAHCARHASSDQAPVKTLDAPASHKNRPPLVRAGDERPRDRDRAGSQRQEGRDSRRWGAASHPEVVPTRK